MLTKIKTVFCLLSIFCVLVACSKPKEIEGTATNDILTFVDNSDNKPIIRIASQNWFSTDDLVEQLQKKFPGYLFVLDYRAAAGVDSERYVSEILNHSSDFDLLISSYRAKVFQKIEFVDLSAEKFLDNYLLSSLNLNSVDGKIYSLSGSSTLKGFAYNVDMFTKNNWKIPTNTEEFFDLCKTIKKAGIKPLSTCFKYDEQINNIFNMMCYKELFASIESNQWLQTVGDGKSTFKGHMEPFFELAKRFYDEGIVTMDSFSASLTKNRKAFWNGEYAMIYYDNSIFSLAKTENAPFEVGIMPFLSKDGSTNCFVLKNNYFYAIPKAVEKDPERLSFILSVLEYLSSIEGQEALLSKSFFVSSVKNVELQKDNPISKFIIDTIKKGNIFPEIAYLDNNFNTYVAIKKAVENIYKGSTVESEIAKIDELLLQPVNEVIEIPNKIATAEEDFTMLETSYYIADKLKEIANTDIAFMINGGFFKSNLASIYKGEIFDDMHLFIMKGMGSKDYLTSYTMTGKNIKNMLEHTIVNNQEIDALVASSGLKIEYAPWNKRGERVLKLLTADDKELLDNKEYTVCAFKGVIDNKYITKELQSFDKAGALTDIMKVALSKDVSIKPDIKNRVKLVWPKAK